MFAGVGARLFVLKSVGDKGVPFLKLPNTRNSEISSLTAPLTTLRLISLSSDSLPETILKKPRIEIKIIVLAETALLPDIR